MRLKGKKIDLRVYRNAEKVMKGVDLVFHLASDVGGGGYSSLHPVRQYYNFSLLDLQVLEAANNAKIKK